MWKLFTFDNLLRWYYYAIQSLNHQNCKYNMTYSVLYSNTHVDNIGKKIKNTISKKDVFVSRLVAWLLRYALSFDARRR